VKSLGARQAAADGVARQRFVRFGWRCAARGAGTIPQARMWVIERSGGEWSVVEGDVGGRVWRTRAGFVLAGGVQERKAREGVEARQRGGLGSFVRAGSGVSGCGRREAGERAWSEVSGRRVNEESGIKTV